MNENQITVGDLFRRAQAIRQASPNGEYKEVAAQLAKEFAGKQFPSPTRLAIPEQDALAPQEDWSAGLPVVLRGIQTENWQEISHGIMICLEQIENYQRDSGSEQSKAWHDRSRGIREQTDKSLGKWLPDDLMKMAENSNKR